MRTPSITTAFAPMSTSSSTITGVALAGSITPASTAPAPMWQCLPTVARPPSTAPMSIMLPSPITAPMLMIAPIMITALSPISTWSRMIAPGSMRALMFFLSSSGMAELRQSFSTTSSSTSSAWAVRTGEMTFQSPKTMLVPLPMGKAFTFSKGMGFFSRR